MSFCAPKTQWLWRHFSIDPNLLDGTFILTTFIQNMNPTAFLGPKLQTMKSNTTSLQSKGKPGLWAIGSILVAMESKYYVLNLASNWSQIYNELRKNVVHPRCNNCTVMIDVSDTSDESMHGIEC